MLKFIAKRRVRVLLATGLLVGCGSEAVQAGDEPSADERAVLAVTDAGVADGGARGRALRPPPPMIVRAADGGDFVEVRTQGGGCPTGSVRATLRPDGSIALTFTAYRSEAASTVTTNGRDCQVTFVPMQTEAREYSVSEVSLGGRAVLAPGAQAMLSVRHYFQGDAGAAEAFIQQSELVGPRDEPFQVALRTKPEEQRWSTCAASPNLYVVSRIAIARSASTAAASSVDLTTASGGMVVKLASRICPPNNG